MFAIIKSFARDESGATAIEYGLIAALVSVAGIGAFDALGSSLVSVFGVITTELTNTATAASGS
jgi:pilus assembly protein Flp/PilA